MFAALVLGVRLHWDWLCVQHGWTTAHIASANGVTSLRHSSCVCFLLTLSFADQDWKLRRGPYKSCCSTWCSGQNEMGGRLEGSCTLLPSFCNTCFCQNQNTCFDWWKDQSFKRRLQKRRLFVPGWKGPWLPCPLSTSLKGWSSPVPQLSEEWSDSGSWRLSGARITLPLSLIPQPISCYFKPFNIYRLPLPCPSHSHELVDTITAESIVFWLISLNLHIWIFNFKMLWWPSPLIAWN